MWAVFNTHAYFTASLALAITELLEQVDTGWSMAETIL